jgi:hypothetical protein
MAPVRHRSTHARGDTAERRCEPSESDPAPQSGASGKGSR